MSSEDVNRLQESGHGSLNYEETKLTLGLPGETTTESGTKSGMKRGFLETIDLNLGSSSGDEQTIAAKPPVAKAQVVGWPPVRAFRKSAMRSCKYVKVAVDGAPYLRKVDLEMYDSYQQLLSALEDMFSCLTIRNYLNEGKIIGHVSGVEYVPTYEDKDGDWMLVGDVPWKMFVESCKRIRLMKSSEAIGLAAPRTISKSSSTS